jgi:uncharacterized protein
MQKVKLPIKIDPVRCAAKRLDYQGIVEAKHMTRLVESSNRIVGDIEADLSLFTDPQGLVVMQGTASVTLVVECQRCSGEFEYHCKAEFSYTPLLRNTIEDELPESYELIQLDENGEFDLNELIEDEIILSLPIVAMHPLEECPMAGAQMTWGEIDPADERPNPFAVLTSLKRK